MKKPASLHSGCVLIAKPFLGDAHFERTVVFICEHTEEGTFGLVLNQATSFTLDDALEESFYTEIPLRIGGPVSRNTLHFLHRLGKEIANSVEVLPNLYWSGDFEDVRTLLRAGKLKPEDIQFFVGYSGWSSQQLQKEYDQEAWVVTDVDADFVLQTPPDVMWREILKHMGGEYKAMAHTPLDPRLN